MLGVETLATQSLASSARERPFSARFAEIQRLAVFDLIYLVEITAYLPAASVIAASVSVPTEVPGPTPKQQFTMAGSGGGNSSGFAATLYKAIPTGAIRGTYVGKLGGASAGTAIASLLRAPPPPLPIISGLIAHYDADENALFYLLKYDKNIVCPLTSPVTINVSSTGGTVNLLAGQHAIIVLNSGNALVQGQVNIVGVAGSGNRIWVIGGGIRHVFEDATTAAHALIIRNVEIAFVEGLFVDKANTAGDCIHLSAGTTRGGTVYIQNSLLVGANYRDVALGHAFTQHGDALQIVNQHLSVNLDLVTMYTWSQGILINSSLDDEFVTGPALVNSGSLSRLNIRVYDTALNPIQPAQATHPAYYLQDDCAAKPIPWTLDRCYAQDDQASNPLPLIRMVSPGPFFGNTAACGAIASADGKSVTFPASSKITGSISYGTPQGDYVSTSFNGLNYQPRGYSATGQTTSALTVANGRVSQWSDSSGIIDSGADIGISLAFSSLAPDADVTFARASTKVVYRSGPVVALTASGQQALTTDPTGATSLGLLIEGAITQLVQNSKLSGGGVTPTGWTTITSGTRAPVASILGNADGATAYSQTAAAERPFLSRAGTLADNTTYTMSMVVEANTASTSQASMLLIGNLGTGGVGSTFGPGWNTISGPFPQIVTNTFTTGTGNTISSWRFGYGVSTTMSGTGKISRPQITATAGVVSFIPSDNAVTPTNAADVATVPLTAGNWNGAAQTLVLKGRTARFSNTVVEQIFCQIDKGSFNDNYRLFRWTDGHLLFQIWTGNTLQTTLDFGLMPDNFDFTVRIAIASNDVRGSLNGGGIVSDTIVTLPTGLTTLRLGREAAAGTEWYGTINLIEAWKSAKTNPELQNGIVVGTVSGPALVQPTASNRPRQLLAAQNGRNVVAFTAIANENLASGATTAFNTFWAGGGYIVEVARYTSLGGSQQSFGLTGGWSVHLQTGVSSGANIVLEVAYTGVTGLWASADFALGPTLRMIEIQFDSSLPNVLPTIRLDGANLAVRVIRAPSGSYVEPSTGVVLQFPSSAFGIDGQFCDVLFYGSIPSATQQATLRSYLDSKWDRTKLATATSVIIPPVIDESGNIVTDEIGQAIG